ncbi:MAG TPA: decaprenyl-phosphate phosphoribosyltransferase [Thermoanaerobaculia bacterium]|jgi:4-hydroxybenzoate polyprenyltransferase|nr:decaprenyl-phosphate phosphoribosyltransferase [Thermoanaerobaculia bacterium]
MPALLRAMRPQQWVKNLFVLAPVVFAHRLADHAALGHALLALAAFCAGSSAVYLLNDVRDREADRHHPLKRQRPIASGALGVGAAAAVAAALTVAALAGAAALGRLPLALLLAFLLLNALYSWYLKHLVIVDVMVLAIGYVLRIEAGAAAVGVAVSSWLLLCTIFVALVLGFSKRRHELLLLADRAADQRRVLSQYSPAFLDQMINVVTASTVLSYALYAISDESVHKHGRGLLYTVPMVLFGVFRYLYLMYQRPGHANPTEDVLSDPPFLVNVGLWSAVVLWVLYAG